VKRTARPGSDLPANVDIDRGRRQEWRRPAVPESIGELRNAVTAFASDCGVGGVRVDLAIAASEAITNAVLHAYVDREPGTIRVVAATGPASLVLRVIDDGRGMQPRVDSPGLGLGLAIIGKLAAVLDVRPGDRGRGTELCMTFAAPGLAPGEPQPRRRRADDHGSV
jgi:anti-sigma regulatory factor (Ser/Thr protein kinase)